MLNFEVLPTPISLRVRTLIAATWLVPWQDLASGCLCATIGANRLTIRTATSPHWFVLVDWNGGSIVVTEWADQAQLYRFSAMAAAFVFVDALLTSHLSKMTEQPQTPADIPAAAEFRPQFEGPLDRVH